MKNAYEMVVEMFSLFFIIEIYAVNGGNSFFNRKFNTQSCIIKYVSMKPRMMYNYEGSRIVKNILKIR